MEDSKEFNEVEFEQKLLKLKDTQEGIQGLSMWCLQKRENHKKIVATWLNVLKQVQVSHRLTLFYLANDVIQHSKRKSYEFVESWGTALQKATTMVRDDKVKPKILRIFKIWKDRQVYDEDFISDLNGLLAIVPAKTKSKDVDEDEFQVQTVVNYIRKCVNLQNETDRSLKSVIKTKLPDEAALKGLKDRNKVAELQKEIEDAARRYEKYMQNLQREIRHRTSLIQALKEADDFYKTQRGEVKVVANAYKLYGNRIKKMQEKLEELKPVLPSPVPSPPLNAPSPSPEDDFGFPNDAFAFSANNGFLTYGNTSLPFDPSDFQRKSPSPSIQSIQVINNTTNPLPEVYSGSNCSIDNFFKTLLPNDAGSYDPSSANLSFSEYSMNDSTLGMGFGNDPTIVPLPAYAPITTMQGYGMLNRNAPYNQPLLDGPPPPPDQILDQMRPKMWGSKWNEDQESLMDAPHSPPEYDQKAVNDQPAIEYQDTDIGGDSADIDHRALTNVLSRKIDIDHRNLISLTGSPGQSSSHTFSNNKKADIDLRAQMSHPPPPPPKDLSHDVDFRLPPPIIEDKSDENFRAPMYNAAISVLDAPALSDLENLLAMAKNVSVEDMERSTEDKDKQPKDNETGNDQEMDMDFSDEEKDQPVSENNNQHQTQEKEENPNMFSLPPPPLPNIMDENGPPPINFDWNNMGGENFQFNDDQPPPPPPMLQQQSWNMSQHEQPDGSDPSQSWNFSQIGMQQMGDGLLGSGPQHHGNALLPTPPHGLMNQQNRQYPPPLMGTRRQGGNGGNNNGNNGFNSPMANNFRPRGRGSPMVGSPMRGSPYFRGGPPRVNFRGNFRGGRGRW